MKKNESLCDDNLEKIGMIKEIDTLGLIEKIEESNRKRTLKFQDLTYAFSAIIILMFQIIIIKKFGIAVSMLFNLFIVMPAPILILIKSVKIYYKGDDIR